MRERPEPITKAASHRRHDLSRRPPLESRHRVVNTSEHLFPERRDRHRLERERVRGHAVAGVAGGQRGRGAGVVQAQTQSLRDAAGGRAGRVGVGGHAGRLDAARAGRVGLDDRLLGGLGGPAIPRGRIAFRLVARDHPGGLATDRLGRAGDRVPGGFGQPDVARWAGSGARRIAACGIVGGQLGAGSGRCRGGGPAGVAVTATGSVSGTGRSHRRAALRGSSFRRSTATVFVGRFQRSADLPQIARLVVVGVGSDLRVLVRASFQADAG